MTSRAVHGSKMLDWLIASGFIPEGDTMVSRVLIDIKSDDVVRVYIERYGSTKALEVDLPHLEPSEIRVIEC